MRALLSLNVSCSLRHTKSVIPNAHISLSLFAFFPPSLVSSGAFHLSDPPEAVVDVEMLAIIWRDKPKSVSRGCNVGDNRTFS